MRREEATARERLEAVLAEIGVDTRVQADERARRTGALRAEVEALRRRRTDLLGEDTLDDLIGRRDALREQYPDGSAPRDADHDDQEDPAQGDSENGPAAVDPASAAGSAEKELAERRAEDRIAATEAETARTDHATRSALATEAESRLAERLVALEVARETITDLALSEVEERTGPGSTRPGRRHAKPGPLSRRRWRMHHRNFSRTRARHCWPCEPRSETPRGRSPRHWVGSMRSVTRDVSETSPPRNVNWTRRRGRTPRCGAVPAPRICCTAL